MTFLSALCSLWGVLLFLTILFWPAPVLRCWPGNFLGGFLLFLTILFWPALVSQNWPGSIDDMLDKQERQKFVLDLETQTKRQNAERAQRERIKKIEQEIECQSKIAELHKIEESNKKTGDSKKK